MRRSLAMGFLIVALTLGATTNALAAAQTRQHGVAARVDGTAVVKTLKWVATFKHAAISGTATLTVSSTYSTGRLHVSMTGVKKGDHIVASIHFRTRKGKTGTIVTGGHTVTGTTGSVSFSFALSASVRKMIKADLAAGDTLKVRITDGKVTATGTFTKA